jgi:L-glyceraldehyde 3-phosphate reductase
MTDSYLARPSELDTRYKASLTRYKYMPYRACGKSGLKLPPVSLGLWQNFGDTDPYSSAREMILAAFDLGVTHFDLGNNYGKPPGSAERTLGRIINEDLKNYRDEIIISTKAGYDMWQGPYGENGSKKHLIASIDQSLKRLGLDYVDIFYSHKFDSQTPLEETMEALAQIVRQGKAIYVGISSYGAEETKRAHKILNGLGIHSLIANQVSYSLLNRWPEEDLLKTLDELGMGCVAFTSLAQGLLSNKYLKGLPPANSRMNNADTLLNPALLSPEVLSRLKGLSDIARLRGQSLSQMALAWVLRNPVVVSTVVGARSVEQIIENINSLHRLEFSQTELKQIDDFAKNTEGVNLWPPNCQTSQV